MGTPIDNRCSKTIIVCFFVVVCLYCLSSCLERSAFALVFLSGSVLVFLSGSVLVFLPGRVIVACLKNAPSKDT